MTYETLRNDLATLRAVLPIIEGSGSRTTTIEVPMLRRLYDALDVDWAELPESVLSNLRSHAFPKCELCGAYVDDPEAIEYCEGPSEQEKRNHDVAVVNATNRNAVQR